jgi:hypothetical protein
LQRPRPVILELLRINTTPTSMSVHLPNHPPTVTSLSTVVNDHGNNSNNQRRFETNDTSSNDISGHRRRGGRSIHRSRGVKRRGFKYSNYRSTFMRNNNPNIRQHVRFNQQVRNYNDNNNNRHNGRIRSPPPPTNSTS